MLTLFIWPVGDKSMQPYRAFYILKNEPKCSGCLKDEIDKTISIDANKLSAFKH